ncbi:MAG: complex I subunit 1 family protein [Capsulimonadales bacterium]|nr:complex I subunit 1 family protein [Capsulimonadales bacterium]
MNYQWWEYLFTLPGNQIPWWAEVVRSVIRLLIGVAGALGSVPILVWLERRLLGLLQGRLGPNRVGPFGLLQPVADALKLFMKEDITPTNVDKTLYYLAPAVALAPIVMSVTVLPWNASRDWGAVAPGLDIGILFLLGVASIEVYGVILAGWSSNNKYSLLGGLRASSQVISYELGMGLSIIAVLLMSGTLGTQAIVLGHDPAQPSGYFQAGTTLTNGQGILHYVPVNGVLSSGNIPAAVPVHDALSGFWHWNVLKLFPFGLIAAVIYMISMIAETNRAPFDLPEAETELVAGFHTEYSSFKFAMFFMGEYANMLIVSAICVTLFFGGWLAPWGGLSQLPYSEALASSFGGGVGLFIVNLINYCVIAPFWFVTKLYTLISFFILVRASFPRLRYDMLMRFGWKGMLPVALVNLVLIAVSLAVQQTVRERWAKETTDDPTLAAWWLGQLTAWAIGGIILGVLFLNIYRDYRNRRAATATDPLAIVPIRRDTVVRPMDPATLPE